MAVLAERPDDAACAVAAEVLLGLPLSRPRTCGPWPALRGGHLRPRAGRPRDSWPRWRPAVRCCGPARDAGDGRGQGAHAGRPGRRPGSRSPPTPRRSRRCRTGAGGRRSASPPTTAGRSCSRRPGAATTARASGRCDDRAEAAQALAGGSRGRVAGRGAGAARAPSWPSWWPAAPPATSVAWPAVETAQVGGVCREVLVPGRLRPRVVDAASALGQQVAEIAGAVGVLAVELFWSRGRPAGQRGGRPAPQLGPLDDRGRRHLAVREPPAGRPRPAPGLDRAPAPAGGQRQRLRGRRRARIPRRLLAGGLAVEGAHVHLYGKAARPGRKLGHVTVCGDDADWCGPGPGRPPWRSGRRCPTACACRPGRSGDAGPARWWRW